MKCPTLSPEKPTRCLSAEILFAPSELGRAQAELLAQLLVLRGLVLRIEVGEVLGPHLLHKIEDALADLLGSLRAFNRGLKFLRLVDS